MRTTLILNDDLMRRAVRATGIQEKTKLVHMGLHALIREAASRRLAQLYGTVKNACAAPRRKAA